MPTKVDDISFDDEMRKEMARNYIELVRQIVSKTKIDPSEVSISSPALSLAFHEADSDVKIMSMRRNPANGISRSKVAGILAFRLLRFSPVHLSGTAVNHGIVLKINALSALALALKMIMNISVNEKISHYVTTELHYSMIHRHMNQETLGMIFDAINRQYRFVD